MTYWYYFNNIFISKKTIYDVLIIWGWEVKVKEKRLHDHSYLQNLAQDIHIVWEVSSTMSHSTLDFLYLVNSFFL